MLAEHYKQHTILGFNGSSRSGSGNSRVGKVLYIGSGNTHTGNTLELSLLPAPLLIKGGLMGNTGSLRITAIFLYSGAGTKTSRIKADTYNYMDITDPDTILSRDMQINVNNQTVTQQVGFDSFNSLGFGVSSSPSMSSTINTAADFNVEITGQLQNAASSITLVKYIVELLVA